MNEARSNEAGTHLNAEYVCVSFGNLQNHDVSDGLSRTKDRSMMPQQAGS